MWKMIDEKKLIAELQNHTLEYKDTDMGIGINVVKEIIKNQPKIGEWIPCSERLPEESGYYLVTYHDWSDGNYLPKFDDIHVRRLHYQVSEHFTGWNYPKCVDKNAEADEHKEVIAWQPLPEPYKEVKENEN